MKIEDITKKTLTGLGTGEGENSFGCGKRAEQCNLRQKMPVGQAGDGMGWMSTVWDKAHLSYLYSSNWTVAPEKGFGSGRKPWSQHPGSGGRQTNISSGQHGYRVSPFLKKKERKKGGTWDLGIYKMLDAGKNRRTCEETVEPWGVLWWPGGAEEGEVLKDPLNFQERDWEGPGQGSQNGKVKEKHSSVSSQRLS